MEVAEYYRRAPKVHGNRDGLILAYRARGWSYRKIGSALGMSANGVMQVVHRIKQTGRYDEFDEREVGPDPHRHGNEL